MKINCAHDALVEPHKLVPNAKNPNAHPPEQIKRLAQIIDYQGQRHPVIVSKRSGFVVVGHGRLEAIKSLGWDKIAVNYQDFESEAQEYAFVVSDNAIAEWAELDLGAINSEMLDLGPDFDIDLLGIRDFVIEPADGELPDLSADEPDCQSVTFVLSNEQKDILDEALAKAKKSEDCSDGINQNSNGNTLAAILRRYVYG
jgi:hypothetical protein